MSRYLKNVETGEVTVVSSDDDQKFNDLIIQRKDGVPVYVQTGAHDPAVNQVKVHGQDPPNGQQQTPQVADDKPGPFETNVQGTGDGVGSDPVGPGPLKQIADSADEKPATKQAAAK